MSRLIFFVKVKKKDINVNNVMIMGDFNLPYVDFDDYYTEKK